MMYNLEHIFNKNYNDILDFTQTYHTQINFTLNTYNPLHKLDTKIKLPFISIIKGEQGILYLSISKTNSSVPDYLFYFDEDGNFIAGLRNGNKLNTTKITLISKSVISQMRELSENLKPRTLDIITSLLLQYHILVILDSLFVLDKDLAYSLYSQLQMNSQQDTLSKFITLASSNFNLLKTEYGFSYANLQKMFITSKSNLLDVDLTKYYLVIDEYFGEINFDIFLENGNVYSDVPHRFSTNEKEYKSIQLPKAKMNVYRINNKEYLLDINIFSYHNMLNYIKDYFRDANHIKDLRSCDVSSVIQGEFLGSTKPDINHVFKINTPQIKQLLMDKVVNNDTDCSHILGMLAHSLIIDYKLSNAYSLNITEGDLIF